MQPKDFRQLTQGSLSQPKQDWLTGHDNTKAVPHADNLNMA